LQCVVYAGDSIPKAAWKRGIGEPLSHAGTKKTNLEVIDDGYWQGAPVGGFGAGTFARTYAGNFSRWHLKTGVNKYETLYANQFAMYQQVEGSTAGIARVLSTDHPRSGALNSWKWDYPLGAGDYYSLYPKSCYLQLEKFPGSRHSGTIFAHSPSQLSRNQLSSRGLPVARGKSYEPVGSGFGSAVLDKYGWLVARIFARLQRALE